MVYILAVLQASGVDLDMLWNVAMGFIVNQADALVVALSMAATKQYSTSTKEEPQGYR
jgi:hypothetical protein